MPTLREKFQNPAVLKAGLWAIALLILADAGNDLWEILHLEWYRVMMAATPDWVVCGRFIVSVALRVVTIWAVLGALFRREPYRKILVGLAWFNALTFYLHHPYSSFVYISNYLGLNTEDFLLSAHWFGQTVYPGAVVRMLYLWVEELLLAFLTLAFFSNPKVKPMFK